MGVPDLAEIIGEDMASLLTSAEEGVRNEAFADNKINVELVTVAVTDMFVEFYVVVGGYGDIVLDESTSMRANVRFNLIDGVNGFHLPSSFLLPNRTIDLFYLAMDEKTGNVTYYSSISGLNPKMFDKITVTVERIYHNQRQYNDVGVIFDLGGLNEGQNRVNERFYFEGKHYITLSNLWLDDDRLNVIYFHNANAVISGEFMSPRLTLIGPEGAREAISVSLPTNSQNTNHDVYTVETERLSEYGFTMSGWVYDRLDIYHTATIMVEVKGDVIVFDGLDIRYAESDIKRVEIGNLGIRVFSVLDYVYNYQPWLMDMLDLEQRTNEIIIEIQRSHKHIRNNTPAVYIYTNDGGKHRVEAGSSGGGNGKYGAHTYLFMYRFYDWHFMNGFLDLDTVVAVEVGGVMLYK
jgi:hypothetical protein